MLTVKLLIYDSRSIEPLGDAFVNGSLGSAQADGDLLVGGTGRPPLQAILAINRSNNALQELAYIFVNCVVG